MLKVDPVENNTIPCRNKAGIALQADQNRGNTTWADQALLWEWVVEKEPTGTANWMDSLTLTTQCQLDQAFLVSAWSEVMKMRLLYVLLEHHMEIT